MLKQNRATLAALESYIDMLINTVAVITGHILTVIIYTDAEPVNILSPKSIFTIFLSIITASFVYHVTNLYKSGRYSRPEGDFPKVLRANSILLAVMATATAAFTKEGYRKTLLFLVLFSIMASTLLLTAKRRAIRLLLKLWHSKNFHLRRVIIIGDNTAAAAHYTKAVRENSDYGIILLGYVGDKIDGDAIGAEKLGAITSLDKILDKYRPTDAVFATAAYDKKRVIRLVNMCDDRCIKVYFLPVIYGFFKSSRQIEQLGSLPLINLHRTPLDNLANAMIKRTVDLVGSAVLIILTLPVMLFAAIGVRISSPGPILFRQTRVGKLGKGFRMLKFRSMRVNRDSNRAWTTGDDPRKTKFGTFLRRTAIDELPQLFNVLAGSMSLVGPRPEIPVFVEHFKNSIPLYMVKHYVKPGITGLAQIKGLRGDTSVEARIAEDIDYIENWSLWLDILILLKTPFKAFNKNEKYTDTGVG